MGLTRYRQKRNFKESPEPQGGTPKDKMLRFVIQKHAASHLHYDFRLEMEGVLKSWAVPKGPSNDPTVKRLAMMVEDHPYDYRNFEGIIPSGYGKGTVIIWDEGTYETAEGDFDDKKSMDRDLRKQLHAGKLKFILHGKKLKGEFTLVKAKGRGENSWLLMKVKDKYASEKDILAKDKSVISSKTLEEVKETSTNFWKGKGKAGKSNETTETKNATKKSAGKKSAVVTQGKKAAFPIGLKPMLATLVDKPFEEPGWIFEVKWDGYRALGFINKGKAEIKSRNDKSFTEKFYPVADALQAWGINAVVDGEIVVVKENGISDFGALQNWRSEADGDLYYYLFDILWLEGRSLVDLTLEERREILLANKPEEGVLRISESFNESAANFFNAAKELGLEGIIAKKANSVYVPGARTKDWLKIKANKRQEVVIGGYTINDDTSKPFSALLAGVYEGDRLNYVGKIGTGFNIETQKKMLAQFKKLETKKVPFTETPDVNKPSRFRPNPPNATVYWLKPQLVCEVSFAELTSEGIMRHPSFEGMRIDKKAKDVVLETATPVTKALRSKKEKTTAKYLQPAAKTTRKTLLNPKEETQVKIIKGHELKFTNLSKIFWPGEGITKRDVLNYYYQIAPYILLYLNGRPQSMNRHPNGIKGKSFYYKDVTGKAPEWVETYLYHSEADGRDRNYLICTDEASLLYMASLGCIEMNPWHSRADNPENPDWCVIDLDPAQTTFEQVIEAANVTKQVLDGLGVPSYPKTSGSSGIHIYIPLGAKYDYEQSKEFARVIATMVHNEIPKFTSIERMVRNRSGKMYIDFLQNRPQATIAGPYSLRPKPGATVSMPLHWEEVKKGLKMKDFTIHNAVARVKETGDLFKPVLGKGINLEKIIKQFES